MDGFSILVLGGLAVVALCLYLIGSHAPGSGTEQLGLRSGRRIVEEREALEAEDLTQLLEASNRRRRQRGERERTVEEIELHLAGDLHEQRRQREAALEDQDLDELLAATNARRRARGLAPRTREQARRELGGDDVAPRPPSADGG